MPGWPLGEWAGQVMAWAVHVLAGDGQSLSWPGFGPAMGWLWVGLVSGRACAGVVTGRSLARLFTARQQAGLAIFHPSAQLAILRPRSCLNIRQACAGLSMDVRGLGWSCGGECFGQAIYRLWTSLAMGMNWVGHWPVMCSAGHLPDIALAGQWLGLC
jgi:hypothetical protein